MENPLVILGGDGVLYRAVRDVGGVIRPVAIGADGCESCCDNIVDPDGAQCYLVVSVCSDQDPSTVYAYETDRMVALGLDWSIGSVIELDTGECFAIQGFYFRPDGEELPAWFSTLVTPLGDPVAIRSNCLDTACGLIPNTACPTCTAPNACVEQKPILFQTNLWHEQFGYDAWCARGAILICTVGWNGTYRNYDGSAARTRQESVVFSAVSVSRYNWNGSTWGFASHSYNASGSYVRTDSANPGSDVDDTYSETQTGISGGALQARLRIPGTPFPGAGLGSAPPSFGSDSAGGILNPPGISCPASDVTNSWQNAIDDGTPSEQTNCTGSSESNCSSYNLNYSAGHDATIQTRYGGATFNFRQSIDYERRFANTGPGCNFDPELNNDDIKSSFQFTETRQVLWLGPGAPTLPSLGEGCPLIVEAFSCDIFPAVIIRVDVSGLLPLPGAVTVNYMGEQRRFGLFSEIVPDDGNVYTPIAVHNNCNDVNPSPGLAEQLPAGVEAARAADRESRSADRAKTPGEKNIVSRFLWDSAKMIRSYRRAVESGRSASPETISLRQLSCFGDPARNIQPCELLRGKPGKRWCGGCGCGRLPEARLDPNSRGESKLQYGYLECPLDRDGFSRTGDAGGSDLI